MTPAPSAHDVALEVTRNYSNSNTMSEADTRHRVIDAVLHDVLSWPRSAVICESYIDPGFADYVLLGTGETQLVFIEAKREGIYFTLPAAFDESVLVRMVKIKTLITDDSVRGAVSQVQAYCINSGCEIAGVTNGHQWIFFKTFERGTDWRDLPAIVITSLKFFSSSFSEAVNLLGYGSIVENASLAQRLGKAQLTRRDVFFPKTKIPEYNHAVLNNHLSTSIRPLADRYLGRMDATDDDFMEKCYVFVRDYSTSLNGVTQIIRDRLTPYFENYNVQEFFGDAVGGEFGNRIASHLRERRTREVIILFGGKGAGKSTFIKKLLYHRPPEQIQEHSKIAVVDLLECPEDRDVIYTEILKQVIAKLDTENLLDKNREELLKLFNDKFQIAKKQALAGLNPESEAYNLRLNQLVESWLADREYCTQRLADRWKFRRRGTIIILDNTDQFSPEVQDHCFTLAQRLATIVDGLVVIAMREERFHFSRLHGTLDAFQNNGFHLSSPPSHAVFEKRLLYMRNVLRNKEAARKLSASLTDKRNDDVRLLFRILGKEFKAEDSHLSQFLRACAHGNMRLSLDMFRQFLLSGYTKVDEMLKEGRWTLQVHQVLRPMMIPDRFFYDESLSAIPNIYQIRSDVSGSHFTGLRILDLVSENVSPSNPVLIPIAKLKSVFAGRFKMLDDLYRNLDMMLRKGLLEANNRLDEYSESVDSVRITAYGYYMRDSLAGMFSYLDLVSVDCAVHHEATANSIARLAQNELDYFFKGQKKERIEQRLARVDEFISYLLQEAAAERDYFSLEPREVRYADDLKTRFEKEKRTVRTSARRYVGKYYD